MRRTKRAFGCTRGPASSRSADFRRSALSSGAGWMWCIWNCCCPSPTQRKEYRNPQQQDARELRDGHPEIVRLVVGAEEFQHKSTDRISHEHPNRDLAIEQRLT